MRTFRVVVAGIVKLAAVLAFAAVLCVFWWPTAFNAAGSWLRERAVAAQVARFRLVAEARGRDSAHEEALLRAWDRDLRDIGKLDTHALAKRYVLTRLVELARARGDHGVAVHEARRLVAFDRYDVDAVVALGEVLGAAAETAAEGLELLRSLQRRVPDHPRLVASLVTTLTTMVGGSGAASLDASSDAVAVLKAAALPRHACAWTLQWGPEPTRDGAFFRPRALGPADDAQLQADLVVDGTPGLPVAEIAIFVPRGLSASIEDVALAIGDSALLPLDAWSPRAQGLAREGDRYVASGVASGAGFVITLPTPLRAGCSLRMRARVRPRIVPWLRDLLEGEVGQRLRAAVKAVSASASAIDSAIDSDFERWLQGVLR
ncbi:MAG TPA: hypothetical protein PKE00_02440 [Planctomycetota bacterium]|nr:hypothetical protein [Planctomycetota bacterium]